MFACVTYGLGVHSELPLPGFEDGDVRQEVVIRFGKLRLPLGPADANGYSFQVLEDGVYLGWEGAARFRVREGREITIAPAPHLEEGVIRALLMGPALAVLLHQRGLLILHASAAVVRGAVVAFLGQKGAGKSTTAATLHERGHLLVADDVVALQTTATAPLVFPAYPQLNLWPDALASLGRNPGSSLRLHSGVEKRALRAAPGFSRDPFPLHLLYILAKGPRTEIETLQPQEAFVELLRHSYGTRLCRGKAAPRHFRQCANVLKFVSVRRLRVRQDLSELFSLARLIDNDAAECCGN